MSNQEVYESRDQLNKKLVETLSMYGNLEPPGIFGRPYNDGSKSKYPFSAANYLRMLAVQRERSYLDPRWISEAVVDSHGLTLKEGAVPVEIEYWKGINSGSSYTGELKKFYNVSEIDDIKIAPKIIQGNQPEDLEYAIDLLKANNIHVTYKANIQQIFDITSKFAKEKGADEFTAPLASQLLLKTSHLALDYTKQPIFSQEQLARLGQNSKILFSAMKKAQTLVNKIQFAQDQSLKKVEDRIKMELELKNSSQRNMAAVREPFKNLFVDFIWSEADLKDLSGKPYLTGVELDEKNPDAALHLRGKNAYEFLVQLNAMDKEKFNDKLHGNARYFKTKFAIRYGQYDHGELRTDLGDLELGNKSSIADALLLRLNEYRKSLINDPVEQNMYLSMHNNGEKIDAAQIVKESNDAIAKCNAELAVFKQEESLFLSTRPELRQVNEQKADTFLYCCKADDVAKLPQDIVLSIHAPEEYPGMVYRNKTEFTTTGKADIVFESALPFDSSAGQQLPIHPIMTKETQKAIFDLEKFSLTVENHGSVFSPMDNPNVEQYKGAAAVKAFIEAKKHDAALEKSMRSYYDRNKMDEIALTFSYNGKKSTGLCYTNGSGVLARMQPIRGAGGIMPLGGYAGADKDTIELKEAIYRTAKQSGIYNNTIMHDLNQSLSEHTHSSCSERRKSIMENKPAARAVNSKQYAYYKELAAQDINNNTPLKLMETMVQEMKHDGLASIKIDNIAKTNKNFNMPLLSAYDKKNNPTIAPEEKTPKEKLQEKAAMQDRKKTMAI